MISHSWQTIRARRMIVSLCDGPFGSSLKSSDYTDEGVRVIRLQNIGNGRFRDDDSAFISDEYFADLNGHDARPGDLLIAALGDDNNPAGRACVVPDHVKRALVKADCYRARFEPQCAHHPFIAYWMNSAAGKAELSAAAKGTTRSRINLEIIRDLEISLPSVHAQRAIADFLDCRTAVIDAFIERKERHIALLAERRQALITGRIFGTVPAASSLQQILEGCPSGWRVAPLWTCFVPVKEQGFATLGLLSVYRDYGVISKDSREDNHNRAGEDLTIYQRVKPGDVVFNRMKAWQGSVAVSDLLGIVSPDYQVLRPRSECFNKAYLHHLLRSSVYIAEYARLSKGIRPSQWRLMYEELRTLPLLIPPIGVQAQIAADISTTLDAGARMASLVGKEIDRLYEYRQALITAAVTGQLDIGGSSP